MNSGNVVKLVWSISLVTILKRSEVIVENNVLLVNLYTRLQGPIVCLMKI